MRKTLMLSVTCTLLACEAGENTTSNDTVSNEAAVSESGRPRGIQEAAKDAGIPAVSLLAYSPGGEVLPNTSKALLSPAELQIPAGLSFADQLKWHAATLDKIGQVQLQTEANQKAAKDAKSFDNYIAAEQDAENVRKLLAPYAVALEQAKELQKQGFKLNDFSGNVCADSNCKPIDAMTAVFFFLGDKKALGPNFTTEPSPQQPENVCEGESGDVCINGFNVSAFIRFLGDKPLDNLTFGLLPGIRDAIIPPNDNGEIAKMIRDPAKRPVEIMKNYRDHAEEQLGIGGDAKKIINDPIKCTLGKLIKKC